MEKIEFPDIVGKFYEYVPDAEVLIFQCDAELRDEISRWPVEGADLYCFLSDVFMYPAVLPALKGENFDDVNVGPYFTFIEGLAMNRDPYVSGAVYFEVYEQFLDGPYEVLARAIGCCLPASKSGLLAMLNEQYPATLAALRRWQASG